MNDDKGKLVVCINTDGFPASLTVDKSYTMLSDDVAEQHGLLRVVDDSGEDYLYPKTLFVPAQSMDGSQHQTITMA